MSHNIKTFIYQTYEIFKRDFWILIVLNITASLLINFLFRPHEVVVFLIVAALFFKNLTFIRSASIMPSVSSDFDRFSWKYYMGMPLNKKELILSLILTNLIVMLPIFAGIICFLPQLIELFADDPSKTKYTFYVKGSFLLIAFFALTSLGSIKQQFINPRRKYSKISQKILFLQRLRNSLIILVGLGYGFYALGYLAEHVTFDVKPYFKWIGSVLNFLFHTWAIVPAAFLFTFVTYSKVLNSWQDESQGYIKNTWIAKRDYSLISACAMAIILPFFIVDFTMPTLYEGTELNRAVYQRNESEIKRLISQGKNINEANANGVTPAMVAIHEGNTSTLRLLQLLGADLNGKVKAKNELFYYNGMNPLHLAVKSKNKHMVTFVTSFLKSLAFQADGMGNLPIHIAAKECSVDVLDTVLAEYKDINIKNQSGKTALHVAVGAHCFPAVDLLVGNNIDINIRDNDNKIAYDYNKDWHASKNEKYLLDKKLRAPASQK